MAVCADAGPTTPAQAELAAAAAPLPLVGRPTVRGKFLFAGEQKLWVRGVTYGAFRPDSNGNEYYDLDLVDRDFAQMAAAGLNAVRIPHTAPPRALLDIAQRHGLRVMIALSAEQYVGFLLDRKRPPDIEDAVRTKVRACAGHPALLCYALGNEIPAQIARWMGRRRIQCYLERLYRAVKTEDADGLVTYVNYPTTEYLDLSFLDFLSFNVYLESQDRLEGYLARLQNIAGDRPLLLSELGLDSLRHGDETQAHALDWQIRTAFSAGCAGAFIFAWTDEWFRGGVEVSDWAFGLTDANRRPKPALRSAHKAFTSVPFPVDRPWPRVSVIVCTHNGARTIRECFDGLLGLQYPDFEIIVVNDGSNDRTAAIAQEYPFRLINTSNEGLSAARNTGLEAATGEIVAYLDDDACPDPDWLVYLADAFLTTTHVGIGGPNVPPAEDDLVAECVANAPGGPIHVLISDREAEHIPGCNMAFRRTALQSIDGFDPALRVAGDDVDVCWRLQARGWTLGFSPGAVVWHRRRNSVRAYWRQQWGYGEAEALLERKWPEKHNSLGHITWSGHMYAGGVAAALGWGGRIYHGPWGTAPFQSLYQPAAGFLASLPLMPEWYLLIIALGGLAGLSLLWPPLAMTLPLLIVAVGASLARAILAAARARFSTVPASPFPRWRRRALTMLLHLIQPLARLSGRLRCGLTPWRRRGSARFVLPWPRRYRVWTDRWQSAEDRLLGLELRLQSQHARVLRGGEFDRWDLEVRGGMFGAARLLMAVEDHGAGRQLVRVRCWPRYLRRGIAGAAVFAALAAAAGIDGAWAVTAILTAGSAAVAGRAFQESGRAMAAITAVTEGALSEGID